MLTCHLCSQIWQSSFAILPSGFGRYSEALFQTMLGLLLPVRGQCYQDPNSMPEHEQRPEAIAESIPDAAIYPGIWTESRGHSMLHQNFSKQKLLVPLLLYYGSLILTIKVHASQFSYNGEKTGLHNIWFLFQILISNESERLEPLSLSLWKAKSCKKYTWT